MNSLLQKLGNLYSEFERVKSPLVNFLQPGISTDYINKEIKNIGIVLPPEVYQLYSWKNGTNNEKKPLGAKWMFPGGKFANIEDSVSAYHYYAGKDGIWKKQMFMLFMSGGGEMYLIDCNKNAVSYGMILRHSIGAVDTAVLTTVYDSLESLIDTLLACYQEDAFFYAEEFNTMVLQANFEKAVKISRKINPKSDLWKIFPF
jgi:hypothetical protein